MHKRTMAIVALACVALLAPPKARGQQDRTAYTYAAVWQLPRADWSAFSQVIDKNSKPVLDRLMAEGTLISWGSYENLVHSGDAETHGVWWTATSVDGITKTILALRTAASSEAVLNNGKHWDFLGQCEKQAGTATSDRTAYFRVGSYLAKPGRSGDFVKWFEKYYQPTLEELKASGTLLAYEIDREYVHTDNPNWVFVVTLAADAASLEKAWTTIAGLAKKRSPEEQKAISDAEADILQPDAHRDLYARATHYAHQ